MFHRSGNLEAGTDAEEADRFMGHVGRLLPDESDDVHLIMLFAFWAFDSTLLSSSLMQNCSINSLIAVMPIIIKVVVKRGRKQLKVQKFFWQLLHLLLLTKKNRHC
jgi:hypothetical protein